MDSVTEKRKDSAPDEDLLRQPHGHQEQYDCWPRSLAHELAWAEDSHRAAKPGAKSTKSRPNLPSLFLRSLTPTPCTTRLGSSFSGFDK